MAAQTWINNISTTLSSALLPGSGTTTVSVPSGVAAVLTAAGLSASKPAIMTLTQPTGTFETSWEIVAVIAASSGSPDTLTIVRAWESTPGVTAGGVGLSWPFGSKLEMRVTAAGQIGISSIAINGQTGTAYTAATSDFNNAITMNNAASNTITLPSTTAVTGTFVQVFQLGLGSTSFVAGLGANVVSANGTVLRTQYSAATATLVAANVWLITGDVVSA